MKALSSTSLASNAPRRFPMRIHIYFLSYVRCWPVGAIYLRSIFILWTTSLITHHYNCALSSHGLKHTPNGIKEVPAGSSRTPYYSNNNNNQLRDIQTTPISCLICSFHSAQPDGRCVVLSFALFHDVLKTVRRLSTNINFDIAKTGQRSVWRRENTHSTESPSSNSTRMKCEEKKNKKQIENTHFHCPCNNGRQ